MKLRYLIPLASFVVPTAVIGYGVVIPRSCIAGVNDLTLGFAASIVGASVTYSWGSRHHDTPHAQSPSSCSGWARPG